MATSSIFDLTEDLDFILEKRLPEWVTVTPKPKKKLYPKSFKNWNVHLLRSTLNHTKDAVLQQMIRDELALWGALPKASLAAL